MEDNSQGYNDKKQDSLTCKSLAGYGFLKMNWNLFDKMQVG